MTESLVRSRRQVLCGLSVALAAPGALAACGSSPHPHAAGAGSAPPGTPLSPLARLKVGGGVLVDVPGGGRLLLVRSAQGEIRAFDPTCPHTGTTVNPPARGSITCPTHGSEFDVTTGELRKGPASRGLTGVAVHVQGDEVVLGEARCDQPFGDVHCLDGEPANHGRA